MTTKRGIKIPFNPLSRTPQDEGLALADAVGRVLGSGSFILGAEVERFEKAWANVVGTRFCVGVGSGTDAIKIALRCAGIGPGKTVLTVANSAPATVTAIIETGASVTYCDVDQNGLMDIFQARDHAFDAIVPVHLYGRAVDMEAIKMLAREKRAAIIEDAAQGHFLKFGKKMIGAYGHAAAWSFYPTKNLGAFGDAGAITTDSQAIADSARRLRNYGLAYHGELHEYGYNSRLDELQAALLTERIPWAAKATTNRAAVADIYRSMLARSKSVKYIGGGNHHIVAVKTNGEGARTRLQSILAARGIETKIHYETPAHRQPIEPDTFRRANLPVTDDWCRSVLSLPMGHYTTKEEAKTVAQTILADES